MGMSMVMGGTKKDDTKYTLDPETKTVIGTKNGKQVSKIIYKDDVMLSDYKVIWCDDTEKGKYALIVKTDGADSTDDEGIAAGKTVYPLPVGLIINKLPRNAAITPRS